jgi:predicted TIM-barrel fold metal-dependent hydrolase
METGVIDCDVHPLIRGGFTPLFPYLTSAWKKILEPRKGSDPLFDSPNSGWPPVPMAGGSFRADAIPQGAGIDPRTNAGLAGVDPRFVADTYLDKNGIEAAVLLSLQGARLDQWADANEATVLAAAYNDYLIEHWLGADSRFRLAMVVAAQDPTAAAAEIRRAGSNQGVVGIWLSPIEFLLGARYYNPIYDAAQELGLTIVLHTSGSPNHRLRPGRSTYADFVSNLPTLAIEQLSNLIFEGTFERFPRLKVVFTEHGWSWVPSIVWHMDENWKVARRSFPWLKKSPGEYVREHVRFTTQPATEVPNDEYLHAILRMMNAQRILMFSSDYPHYDADLPRLVLKGISPELRRAIFHDNAVETYGPRLLATRVAA